MLKAALIDVGGTLWPDRWPGATHDLYTRALSRGLSLSSEKANALLFELEKRDPAFAESLPLVQDSIAMAAESLRATGLNDIDPAMLLEAMDLPAVGVITPLRGAEAFLRKVRSLGLRTIVFSNATYRTAIAYRRDFDALGFGGLVDDFITSVDLGFRKPSREIFDAAVEAAGCYPEECVVVGDSEEKDIRPALAIGMQTVLVAIESPAPEDSDAGAVVTSLDEAASVILRLNRTE